MYLVQFGFHQVAAVGILAQKQETDSTKGETAHITVQIHRIHKMENKNTKQEKTNKEFKTHKSSNLKITYISKQ